MSFKIPQGVPQDLLLIHEIIGAPAPPLATQIGAIDPTTVDDIDSSDSENGSEDEIEADLLVSKPEVDERVVKKFR